MRSRWFVRLGAVAALIAVLDAGGVAPAAAEKVAQIAFTGRVLDPSGQPVADAKVTLYRTTLAPISKRPRVERVEEKTTGADGAFAFTAARDSETYRAGCIVVRKEGRAIGWAAWPMREDHQKTDIMLGDPKELTGVVVDEAGKPIAAAAVSVALALIGREEDRRYLSVWEAPEVLNTKTDNGGRFVFAQMPAEATFEFFVRKPGWATVWTLKDSYGYREGKCQFAAGQAGIKLTLSPEAKIMGTVVEKATGQPVAGIQVSAKPEQDAHPTTAEPVASAPNGSFSIGDLPGGSYSVQLAPQEPAAWVAEPVRVSLPAGAAKSDVTLQLTKGGVLEVLVKEGAGGKPVEKATVNVRDPVRDQYLGGQTNAAGLAQIRVLPGPYEIWGAYKPGYSQQRQQQPVEIKDGETKRIEYTLAPSPRVAGVVRDGAGNPLSGVRLAILPHNSRDEKTTDSDGKFEMSWDPGSWGPGGTTFVLVARDTTRNLGAIEELDEQMGTLDVRLQPGLVLAGKVLNHEGKPLADARLRVVLRVSNWGAFLGQEQEEKTAQDGTFEIKAIPPQRQYIITALAEGYGKHEVRVDALEAKDNRMALGEFKLLLADLTLSGVVVDTNDQPVAGAEVYADGESQPEQPNVLTDSQGKFVIAKVCAGPIRLGASVRPPDRRYGSIETEGGATDVKVVVSTSSSGQPYTPRKPQPLIGRPLPDLKTVGIELPPDANDRMLLVCFWDMSQRPSRHCLTQLARQAAQLNEKGVLVLAIQAAKAERSALKQWMQDNKAPFQVGYLAGNIEKTRFAWGAVSLPHLILTDKKHVVVAEGFSVNELDAKIQTASGR